MRYSATTAKVLLAVCLIIFFKKGNNQTIPSLQTPANLQPCEDLSFSKYSSSFYFDGACYFPVNRISTWHRAKEFCEDIEGSLASIHSMEEVKFILRLLRHSDLRMNNNTWIGLMSLDSEDFQWADQTAVDFTYFAASKPNNFDHHEKCVNMNINGLWNNVHCSESLPFICKRIIDTSHSTVIPTQDSMKGNCKEGWIAHLDRCYYIGGKRQKDRLNFTEAMDFCRTNGGYLTSIRDVTDQDFLAYLLQIIGEDAWIGLRAQLLLSRRVWLDNTEFSFSHFAISSFTENKDCLKMMYTDRHDGMFSGPGEWIDEDCNYKLGFICYTRRDPSLPLQSSDSDIHCAHPKGWHKLHKMCFQVFKEDRLTWEEAERSCNKEGGHLVSVSDFSVKAVFHYLARGIKTLPFFIGLKYDSKSRSFQWLNNFPVTISPWETTEPSFMTQDTCFGAKNDGYWKKVPCDEKLPYICQITKGKPKIKKFVGNCSSSSNLWVSGKNDYCYSIVNELPVNYYTAKTKCYDYDSRLLSLHSMEETKEVVKLLKPGVRSIYLGLKNFYGVYSWDDSTPINFVNWDKGEPSDLGDRCVEMVTDSMKWRVANCKDKKHFICIDRKSTLVEEHGEMKNYSGTLVVEHEEMKKYSEHIKISIAASCAIIFGVLVCATLIVAILLYIKGICGKIQLRRQERYNSVFCKSIM